MHQKEWFVKTVTSDSNMTGSAANRILDFAMDGIIAGVTIHLTNSPDLVVALVAIEILMDIHGLKAN